MKTGGPSRPMPPGQMKKVIPNEGNQVDPRGPMQIGGGRMPLPGGARPNMDFGPYLAGPAGGGPGQRWAPPGMPTPIFPGDPGYGGPNVSPSGPNTGFGQGNFGVRFDGPIQPAIDYAGPMHAQPAIGYQGQKPDFMNSGDMGMQDYLQKLLAGMRGDDSNMQSMNGGGYQAPGNQPQFTGRPIDKGVPPGLRSWIDHQGRERNALGVMNRNPGQSGPFQTLPAPMPHPYRPNESGQAPPVNIPFDPRIIHTLGGGPGPRQMPPQMPRQFQPMPRMFQPF